MNFPAKSRKVKKSLAIERNFPHFSANLIVKENFGDFRSFFEPKTTVFPFENDFNYLKGIIDDLLQIRIVRFLFRTSIDSLTKEKHSIVSLLASVRFVERINFSIETFSRCFAFSIESNDESFVELRFIEPRNHFLDRHVFRFSNEKQKKNKLFRLSLPETLRLFYR